MVKYGQKWLNQKKMDQEQKKAEKGPDYILRDQQRTPLFKLWLLQAVQNLLEAVNTSHAPHVSHVTIPRTNVSRVTLPGPHADNTTRWAPRTRTASTRAHVLQVRAGARAGDGDGGARAARHPGQLQEEEEAGQDLAQTQARWAAAY